MTVSMGHFTPGAMDHGVLTGILSVWENIPVYLPCFTDSCKMNHPWYIQLLIISDFPRRAPVHNSVGLGRV